MSEDDGMLEDKYLPSIVAVLILSSAVFWFMWVIAHVAIGRTP